MNNNYFPHDYYARNDPKMIKLRRIMKFEGVGIFWSLLEILWENEGFILETDIENIAYEMQTQCERIKNVLHNFDLFKFENGKYFSESQQFRMKLKLEKSKKASESATVRWNKAKAMQTQCEGNAIKEVKEIKESKEKEVKESCKNAGDFINQILNIFCDEYKNSRGIDFDLLTPGKERAGIGKLLKIQKEKKPDNTSEQTLIDFKQLFKTLLSIKEKWHYERMSPSHIASNFNELKNKFNGKKQGFTNQEWDYILGETNPEGIE